MTSRLAYLHLILAYFEGQGQGHAHFDCQYISNGDGYGKSYIANNIKLHMALTLAYLHLTLAHSKGRAHIDCQYLANGDR